MGELWKISCYDGTEEQWTEDVRLSDQDMRTLLQMLLCRTLGPHEIIAAVTGQRDHLLEIRQEGKGMYTAGPNVMHYTAQRLESKGASGLG